MILDVLGKSWTPLTYKNFVDLTRMSVLSAPTWKIVTMKLRRQVAIDTNLHEMRR